MDNFVLGLQSGVPTLSQYFGTFSLTIWTSREWIELPTLGGHRMNNFRLGLQPGVPTLGTAPCEWPLTRLVSNRVGVPSSWYLHRNPYNLTPPPPLSQDLLWLTLNYSRCKQAVTHRYCYLLLAARLAAGSSNGLTNT